VADYKSAEVVEIVVVVVVAVIAVIYWSSEGRNLFERSLLGLLI